MEAVNPILFHHAAEFRKWQLSSCPISQTLRPSFLPVIDLKQCRFLALNVVCRETVIRLELGVRISTFLYAEFPAHQHQGSGAAGMHRPLAIILSMALSAWTA